jgi:hypothetical protein
MGGYGLDQYYYLLQTKAFGLKLAMIICGLYMGTSMVPITSPTA